MTERNMVRGFRHSLQCSWHLGSSGFVTHRSFVCYRHFRAACRSHFARYPVGNFL